MFHFILFTAYLVPGIYLFMRIRYLFIGKKNKLTFTVLYFLLFSIYPVSEWISGENPNRLCLILTTISEYLLPFLLYLFLLQLLYDIFLLFNYRIRLILPEARKKSRYRRVILACMILISMTVVIAGAINLNTIRLSEYFIKLPRKSSTLHHLKIAFISDIHLNNNSSAWFIEKFAGKLKEINPDIVLYGGDIVEGDHEKESTNSIEMAFNSIKVPFGSYGVYGNHEYHGQNNHDTLFKRIGICILRDSVIRFENMFYLAGRLDQEVINRKTIQQLIGRLPNDLPVILLDHRPTDMQNISRSMADLSFSGHTHHGQLFPINLITQKLYGLSWGYRKISNTHFFVTSGLRLWGPPVRTTGKSEIMVINIDFIPDIDLPGKN